MFLAARDLSRLPQGDERAPSWRKGALWRYAAYLVAAIVCSVGLSLGSMALRTWLQRQEDQAAILRTVATNSRLRSLLTDVVPNAARIRVATVRNQPGTDVILGYAITYGVATPNHSVGLLGKVLPASVLADRLGPLTEGNCVHSTQQQFDESLHLSDVIACPIANRRGGTLGFLFLSWDRGDPVPADFDDAIVQAKRAASDIAAIWSGEVP